MNWKTFVIGWALAVVVLLLAQESPQAAPAISGTALIDLYGQSTSASAPPQSASPLPRRVVVPLVVLDVGSSVAADPNYLVSMDDIVKWEDAHGEIPEHAVVLARASAPVHWLANRQQSSSAGHFPGYSADAVHFLVEARDVYGLGTDTPEQGRSLVLPYRYSADRQSVVSSQ